MTFSKSNFLMLKRGEFTDFLQEKYPNAFLLLCWIARCARYHSGHPDGKEIGMADIGNYKRAGIKSEQQYKTAKKRLVSLGLIEIVATNRKKGKKKKLIENLSKIDKNLTTELTTSGTLVKLLRSDIWDINAKLDNDSSNDSLTTYQRPPNDKQERTIKNNKEQQQQQEGAVAVSFSETFLDAPIQEQNNIIYKGSPYEIYECLNNFKYKDKEQLTNEDKIYLTSNFSEDRVVKALNFINHPKTKLKKTLMHALSWHCREKNPPPPPENDYSEQQKLAFKFIQELKEIDVECFEEENKKMILENKMLLPGKMQISLNNSVETLIGDFEFSKKEILSKRK